MPVPQITRSDLYALARKYRLLTELRRAAELEPGPALSRRMLALGREFPGALTELDRLTLDELDRRLEAIERGLATGAVESWMVWMCAYHQSMRAVHQLRRRVAGNLELARALAAELAGEAERVTGFPCDAELVVTIAATQGSIEVVVFERLSRELGAPAPAIRRALFPESRARGSSWARI